MGRRADLIVLDWSMPVLNGTEFLARMRGDERLRDIPVVLMTAATPRRGDRAPDVAEVLLKPFEVEELLRAVARHRRPPA